MDLEVQAGELLLLCGPSGGGKSTLLRLLLGLVPRLSGGRLGGQVEVLGFDPTVTPPNQMAAAGVGLLFQNPIEGFVAERVEDEVAFGPENLGLPADVIQRRVAKALNWVSLGGFGRRRLREISSGQQQRVALAAALALRPSLLLLDEPTAHLDPASAAELLVLLDRLRRESGATMVLCEHRLGAAAPLADRAVVLAEGRVVAQGPPAHVFEEPGLVEMGVPVPRATQAARALGLLPPLPLTPRQLADRLVDPVPATPVVQGLVPCPRSNPPPATGNPSASIPEPALEFQDVAFRYTAARWTLRSVTLRLMPGEVVALVGPTGAGKSTLGRLALGLLRPTEGRVTLCGRDTRTTSSGTLARFGGLVLQNPLLQLLTATVEDELLLGLGELPRSEARVRVDALLERFDLVELRHQHPMALSEGQRRRVALAATLARAPRVLLLDEPTLGQDERQRAALAELVRELAAEGAAVLAISHDPEFVNDACERVVVLRDGRLVADLSLDEPPAVLEASGVPLADLPALSGELTRQGRSVRARYVGDLVALGGTW